MKNIIVVTGGAGFVGSNLIKLLIKKTNSGLTSINGDDETFKNNALLLIQNSNLREKMSLNSKNLLFDKFTTEIASTKILSHQKIWKELY